MLHCSISSIRRGHPSSRRRDPAKSGAFLRFSFFRDADTYRLHERMCCERNTSRGI
jgi:hypothetical protein